MRTKLRGVLAATTLLAFFGCGTAFAFALLELPGSTRPDPEAGTWKAVAASGLVEAALSGAEVAEWTRVRRGDNLEDRTAVRTGRRGRTTLIQQAHVMLVDPNSHVLLAPAAAADGTTSVVQEYGSVVYEIDGSTHPDFRVVTPYLVAGVKGTVFLVSVTDTHASVTVEEGIVEVMSQRTGDLREVRAGETMLVDAEETAEDMALISQSDRKRSPSDSPRGEVAHIARLEKRKLDRAVDRLAASLADSGFEGMGLTGAEEVEITRFLQGHDDRLIFSDDLAGTEDVLIQILGSGAKEELIEDLSDEDRNEELGTGGTKVSAPNQPMP